MPTFRQLHPAANDFENRVNSLTATTAKKLTAELLWQQPHLTSRLLQKLAVSELETEVHPSLPQKNRFPKTIMENSLEH